MPSVVKEGLLEEGDVDLKGRAILKPGERETHCKRVAFPTFLGLDFFS